MHIVLLGDSILDNAAYVDKNHSVQELLKAEMPGCEITLLAIDGALTSDIHTQLEGLPETATHVFVSCGGNDAIEHVDVLNQKCSSVEEALDHLSQRRESFRHSYTQAIDAVRRKHENVAVFTVYNKIPNLNLPIRTALALFNEVILEELSSRMLPIVDLRVIFSEDQDYSPVSPIEPSVHGSRKIVSRIGQLVKTGFNCGIYV